MKAKRSTAPTKVSQIHERALKITPHKEMLKMKVAPNEFMKTNELLCFRDELLKGKGIGGNCEF